MWLYSVDEISSLNWRLKNSYCTPFKRLKVFYFWRFQYDLRIKGGTLNTIWGSSSTTKALNPDSHPNKTSAQMMP